jgi:hypothetical protein
MQLPAQRLAAQAQLTDKRVPFASDLVLGRPLPPPNPFQLQGHSRPSVAPATRTTMSPNSVVIIASTAPTAPYRDA